MPDPKLAAAKKAFQLIQAGQTIGLGDGSTILHLAQFIADDKQLASSLTLATSSAKTINRLKELDLSVQSLSALNHIDIYFDGCDQFDRELNCLKSGSGIHAMEKIVASMAGEFILVGDSSKFSEKLTADFPIVIEVIPAALGIVRVRLQAAFPQASINLRKLEQATNDRGNYLLEMKFEELPELSHLNTFIKMLPGVVDHSLFYQMATKAITEMTS